MSLGLFVFVLFGGRIREIGNWDLGFGIWQAWLAGYHDSTPLGLERIAGDDGYMRDEFFLRCGDRLGGGE